MSARDEAGTREILVWDLPTRAFHWLLVILVVVAVASGKLGHLDVHFAVGYAILALLLFRVAWGVMGSQTARFADFLKGPGAVLEHLHDLARPGPARHPILGHNPLGGLMVVALVAVLLVQAVTGLFTSDDIMVDGPLVKIASSEVVSRFSTIHRLTIDVILVMVGLHVVAVFTYLAWKRENLVRPMITGRKAVPTDAPVTEPRLVNPVLALAMAVAAAGVVAAVLALA